MRRLLLVLAILPLISATASAQNYSQQLTIMNQTQDVITFTMSWSGGPSGPVTLYPGKSTWGAWYPGSVFTITYAPNVNAPGQVTTTLPTYLLPVSPNPVGKIYAFRQNPSDRNVFIVPLN